MPARGLDSADEARNASERGEQLERLSCLSDSIGTLARELAHARGLEHGAHQDDTAKREKPSDEFQNVSPCNVTSLATHWHRRADARVEDELASLCTSIEAHCRRLQGDETVTASSVAGAMGPPESQLASPRPRGPALVTVAARRQSCPRSRSPRLEPVVVSAAPPVPCARAMLREECGFLAFDSYAGDEAPSLTVSATSTTPGPTQPRPVSPVSPPFTVTTWCEQELVTAKGHSQEASGLSDKLSSLPGTGSCSPPAPSSRLKSLFRVRFPIVSPGARPDMPVHPSAQWQGSATVGGSPSEAAATEKPDDGAQTSFRQAAANLKAQISALEKTLSDDEDAEHLRVKAPSASSFATLSRPVRGGSMQLASVAEEDTDEERDGEPGWGGSMPWWQTERSNALMSELLQEQDGALYECIAGDDVITSTSF